MIQGNGGCLLKPVLKLKSATKKAIEPVLENPGSEDNSSEPEEELVETPDENDSSGDGFEDIIPVIDGQEPIVSEEDLRQLL
ncbi:hypothetical protein D3C87_1672480 [compost metagenome]